MTESAPELPTGYGQIAYDAFRQALTELMHYPPPSVHMGWRHISPEYQLAWDIAADMVADYIEQVFHGITPPPRQGPSLRIDRYRARPATAPAAGSELPRRIRPAQGADDLTAGRIDDVLRHLDDSTPWDQP